MSFCQYDERLLDMLLKSSNRPKDFNAPTDTAEYKVEQAQKEIKIKRDAGLAKLVTAQPGDEVAPALDLAALKAKYDPARETGYRYHIGVFRVPIGISQEHLDRMVVEKTTFWIDRVMLKQGWDWDGSTKIQTSPGIYPARNLNDNTPDLGSREMMVRARFRKRDIEIVKTELRPEDHVALIVGEDNVIRTDTEA